MAVHEISVTLRSDPSPYEDAIKRMSKATSEWELSTAAGADDVDEKFADVIRALVDMERQGGRTEADVKKALQGIGLSAEDAEDAVKAIDKELDAVGKNDGGKKAADDLGEIKGGSDVAGESLRGLGDIANDVLSGDFSSAAQGAIGSLGDIASAAGIGGAAGGAIFTAVSGLVGALIEQFGRYDSKVSEVRDSTSEALVEMGGAFDAAALQGRLRDIVNDTEKWAQANLISQQTGLDLGTVLSGMAGNAEDAALASQAFADVWDKIPGSVDTQVMYDAKASLEGVTSALDGAPAKIDAVSAAMERQASQLYDAALASGEATGKIDDLGNAISRMPDGKEVVVNAQTQKAYEDLNALEQKPIPNKQFTVKALIDDSEVRAWRVPMKVGYVEMRPKPGGMLSDIWGK